MVLSNFLNLLVNIRISEIGTHLKKDPYHHIVLKFQMQQNNDAEDILKELLTINPKLWDIHATYGDFLMSQERPAEAANMFREVTKICDNFKVVFMKYQLVALLTIM